MSIAFPEVRVGDPVCCESLAVFPLFREQSGNAEYDLSDVAMVNGTVVVQEVSEAGTVPELSVENKGAVRVLFLEGEELVGAKQNRILNTSILVAAHTSSRIPVSCVEAGRWRYKSRRFGSEGRSCSSSLRHMLKTSVSKSIREKRGYRSNQGEIWDEVARQQRALGAESSTSAMSDTYEKHRGRLNRFREELPFREGAAGMAIVVGGKVAAIDLFDKSATCKKIWERLLSGAVLDAMEVRSTEHQANPADVERAIAELNRLPWEKAESVGEGEEYRAESPSGGVATALTLDGTLVHGSVVFAR